jgi:hypothetical protein
LCIASSASSVGGWLASVCLVAFPNIMTFIACLLVTRSVYRSDDRRAAGSTTAMQIFLRAIARGYEPLTSSFAPGGVSASVRTCGGSPCSPQAP